MLGPRLNTVFKSRWRALWWSATILLTAYCSVPAAHRQAQAPDGQKPAAHHANPWAKDAK
jgi:hypothetical protein